MNQQPNNQDREIAKTETCPCPEQDKKPFDISEKKQCEGTKKVCDENGCRDVPCLYLC